MGPVCVTSPSGPWLVAPEGAHVGLVAGGTRAISNPGHRQAFAGGSPAGWVARVPLRVWRPAYLQPPQATNPRWLAAWAC